MGMLTDFFVASPKDAKRYEQLVLSDDEKSDAKLKTFGRVEHKGLTGLELGALWAILAGKPFAQPAFSLKIGPMSEEGEGILEEFPSDFKNRLTEMPESKLPEVAAAWSKAEGVSHSAAELEPIIQDLKRLGDTATKDGRNMYMWYSI